MGLADELPKLIQKAELFDAEHPKKAGRNLSNAGIFLVTDLDAAKIQPIHWLLHVRGNGSFQDNKQSGQNLERFRPELAAMGFQELREGDVGFDAAWQALLTACARFGRKPSKRNGKVVPTGRRFFVRSEARSVDRQNILTAFDAFDRTSTPDGFNGARKWFVLRPDTGQLYPAKIIWGIASGEKGRDFNAHQAKDRLKKLDFECVNLDELPETLSPEEVPEYLEGAERQVTRNVRERDPKARTACINHYRRLDGGKLRCRVCLIDFGERYGPLGTGFIHVHHIDPMSAAEGEHKISPKHDLVPVCPNCHAMLHRRNPPLTCAELVAKMKAV